MGYFAPYLDETGLHLPTYADRLEALCAAYRGIFGQDAVLEPAVPDYQLLSVFARALDDVSTLLLTVYNSRNPAYAAGQALDLLLPLCGLARRGATRSEASLELSGLPGAEVPAGSVAADLSGALWETETDAVLTAAEGEASASATVRALCLTPGAIYTPAGSICRIVSPAAGWTGVTNPAGSTIGLAGETDAEVRGRIRTALAARGACTANALEASLRQVPNVRAVSLAVNSGEETDARGIPPHTLAAVVLGGAPAAIGQALFDRKALGVGTWGDISVPVRDGAGQQGMVRFSRPGFVPLYIRIALQPLAGYDSSAVPARLKAAVAAEIAALPIGEGLNVPRLYGTCYAAAGALAPTFVIRALQATTPGGAGDGLAPLAWNQLFTCPEANVLVEDS